MKNQKKNPEDCVTEHIVVTRNVWILLWDLRVRWKCKRLSDVISKLIKGEFRDPPWDIIEAKR